uniref:Uncharacterized protein n=1 Tax=Photinus pyralis TaxID=7054 RepID=A0A1Y1KQU4_PHOPY
MVWTHDDTQNNLSTIEANQVDKYCRYPHKMHHFNPTTSKTTCDVSKSYVINTISSTGPTGEVNSVHWRSAEASNNLLHNQETKKTNVHLIQAEIHNEKSNSAVPFFNCQYKIQCSDPVVEDKNVIIANEVLKKNVNFSNFEKGCKYNFNYNRHGKNKVNMLVHRHTL